MNEKEKTYLKLPNVLLEVQSNKMFFCELELTEEESKKLMEINFTHPSLRLKVKCSGVINGIYYDSVCPDDRLQNKKIGFIKQSSSVEKHAKILSNEPFNTAYATEFLSKVIKELEERE